MIRPTPLIAAYGIWSAWAVSWIVAGLWRGRVISRGSAGPTRFWLALAALGFLGLFAEAPGHIHPLWDAPTELRWALVALVALGCGFAWWARIHLGTLWSGSIVAREGHRVVDSGPYALVRHPIYTGLFAACLGLALLKPSMLALAGYAVIVIAFAGKARVEERFLATELGEGAYGAYKARVPMLLPLAAPRPPARLG